MIRIEFTERGIDLIEKNRKTQTRRVKSRNPNLLELSIGNKLELYNNNIVFSAVVSNIYTQMIDNISRVDCIAEGITNSNTSKVLLEFKQSWDNIYTNTQYSFDNNPEVIVIEFKKI